MKYLQHFENYNNIKIKISDLEKIYDFFHLSKIELIDSEKEKTFTFIPRIPTQPYGFETKIIEDNFTKRISLAKKIKNCLSSLQNDEDETYYVYGVINPNNVISLKDNLNNCPLGYDENFDLDVWINNLPKKDYKEIQKYIYDEDIKNGVYKPDDIDYTEIDVIEFVYGISDLPNKYKQMFYCCVPDAEKYDEYWALSKIKMDYLGKITGEDVFNLYHIGDSTISLNIQKNDTPNVLLKLKNNI